MNKIIALAATIGIGLTASVARAQDPGSTFSNGGTFVLSAERLGGLSFTNDTVENTAGTSETNTTTTEFAFGAHVFGFNLNPYVMTQLGFDFFVIDHLSLGAAVDYWQASGEQETSGEPSEDLNDVTAFRLTPRVGYGMMFTDVIGLWARGGLTYYNWSIEEPTPDNDQTTESSWAVTLEGLLVISPIDHFAIHLGPIVDLGFGGERETDPAEPADPTETQDVNRNHYGVMVGIMGWL